MEGEPNPTSPTVYGLNYPTLKHITYAKNLTKLGLSILTYTKSWTVGGGGFFRVRGDAYMVFRLEFLVLMVEYMLFNFQWKQ